MLFVVCFDFESISAEADGVRSFEIAVPFGALACGVGSGNGTGKGI